MNHKLIKVFLLAVGLSVWTHAEAQQPAPLYDESQVPKFTLPDLLRLSDGTPVTSRKIWEKKRRTELMELFASQEYGRTPREKLKITHELLRENKAALDGLATEQQVRFTFYGQGRKVEALLLVYVPNQRQGRVPTFVSYNFRGNHSMSTDESILYSPYFNRLTNREDPVLVRNNQASRWPIADIVKRGYAVATMCYQDLFPDNAKGRPESVAALFKDDTDRQPDSWNAIGVWAWGYSRIADWVVKQPWADRKKLIVLGHSRLGKTALWAGVQDQRFPVVISNCSGCSGAALSKRQYGETVGKINQSFPHWFCPAYKQYSWNESRMPFDQHELLALVAPRHLYVVSAEEDRWADPKGEFLSTHYASPVWKLYGLQGIEQETMPQVNQPIMTDVGYHIRTGVHDVTPYDWQQYMNFCDRVLR
ncbi:MAG: acetylxylan esterase [Bacteroidaceae bacterium]|nr:acetylxylan esterase [Bacteroidaceae bacterium]